jgi:hypothetical protein
MATIPIGTFLSKLQYSHNEGKLSDILYDDPVQPFHFAVVKAQVNPDEEWMIYHCGTSPGIRGICSHFITLFTNFRELLGEEPKSLEAHGVRAAFKLNETWNTLFILFTCYRYPGSFLYNGVLKLSSVLSQIFSRPSYRSAQFAQKSRVLFSKAMTSVSGISSVIATWKSEHPQKMPNLLETDSILVEVGPDFLLSAVFERFDVDPCSVFVFGRLLYSSMNDGDLVISELLVANLDQTTWEKEAVDGRVFCLARHFHTVMVTITTAGRGLEMCCRMQVALMKLDAQGLITKMQQAFAKKLPPEKALDTLIVSGSFTLTNLPFVSVPLFAPRDLRLQANAVAAEMYEKMSQPGSKCIVDDIIGKTDFRIKFVKHGNTKTFIHTAEAVNEQELAPIPHMLKAIRAVPEADPY